MKNKIKLNVEGMSCNHCVKSVQDSLRKKEGVTAVNVSLENKTVEVAFDENKIKLYEVKEAIEDQGYDVK